MVQITGKGNPRTLVGRPYQLAFSIAQPLAAIVEIDLLGILK